MTRVQQNSSFSPDGATQFHLGAAIAGACLSGVPRGASKITALNIEFVAKPSEAHKVHAALPPAINEALGGVEGYAGSLVMISNYEARLVTVVTLWSGQDQMLRCNQNVRWVRALVAPYLDRCLRIQTLAAYIPEEPELPRTFEEKSPEGRLEIMRSEEAVSVCVV